nr:outer membrane protein transport protein [Endozoicomonas sp.]
MKHCHALLLTFPLIALNASAGGIILSEMATFDSVSSAGVANALNRKDASAAMSSPAGLTHIEDYSYSIGLQYVDADFDFKGELNETTPVKTSGANQQFAPGLAYAQRVSDSVVLAGSLHAEGGLGMKYSNGLNGQNMVDELAISVINMNFAAGYQATSNLSLGGGLIVQHIISELEASHGDAKVKGDGSSTELGFLLSAMFDLSDSTYIAANYKSKIEHDYKLDLKANSQTLSKLASATTWPATLDVGVSHNLNEQMNIKIRAAYENWKDYGNASGHDMENIYSLGTSLSYTHQK